NSGAEPTPPKLPQPSAIRATVSPGIPPPASATIGLAPGSLPHGPARYPQCEPYEHYSHADAPGLRGRLRPDDPRAGADGPGRTAGPAARRPGRPGPRRGRRDRRQPPVPAPG